MKLRNLLLAAPPLLALAAPTQAGLITIGFDALPSGNFTGPATEDGFTLTATNATITNLASLVTGFSPPNYISSDATGNWVLTLVESDASAFEFLGLEGSSTQTSAFGGNLTVRGFQGATLAGTDVFPVIGANPANSFSASVLSGLALTRVEIEGQYEFGRSISAFADNIRLETDATPVPAPTTALLLIPGLLAMARRRRSAV